MGAKIGILDELSNIVTGSIRANTSKFFMIFTQGW
jgi:hypothetical protein